MRRTVPRRALRAGAGIVLAAFLVASSLLFVWPASDPPARADAILSLDGSDEGARARLAVSLVDDGYSRVLLFSQGAYRSTPCPSIPGARVVCFVPHPARTVGEVEFAVRYALRRHWGSLLVVSGRAQATRARVLMKRCFPGRTIVVPAPASWVQLPVDVLYEWGALAKALFLDPGC